MNVHSEICAQRLSKNMLRVLLKLKHLIPIKIPLRLHTLNGFVKPPCELELENISEDI